MAQVINWFDHYRIDHKVDHLNGVVVPLDKLTAEKRGSFWYVNGKRVSRKFIAALKHYYG